MSNLEKNKTAALQNASAPGIEPGAEPDISDEALAKAMAGELTEEQENLLKELDKEQSVRKFANPSMAKFFYLLCIAIPLYLFSRLSRRTSPRSWGSFLPLWSNFSGFSARRSFLSTGLSTWR